MKTILCSIFADESKNTYLKYKIMFTTCLIVTFFYYYSIPWRLIEFSCQKDKLFILKIYFVPARKCISIGISNYNSTAWVTFFADIFFQIIKNMNWKRIRYLKNIFCKKETKLRLNCHSNQSFAENFIKTLFVNSNSCVY